MANPYETEDYLSHYLLFHYGRPEDQDPYGMFRSEWLRFHERIRTEYLAARPRRRGGAPTRGLDIGCGVGRFSFELGVVVDDVLGIDKSRPFIRAAQQMAKQHAISVRITEEGTTRVVKKLILPRNLRRSSVEFRVGDAMDLSSLPTAAFEVVAAINLVCRVPRPRQLLHALPRLLAPGGQLIISSPSSWSDEFTPRGQWLPNEELPKLLAPRLGLARRGHLPFVIREHRRKYEFVLSELFVFVTR